MRTTTLTLITLLLVSLIATAQDTQIDSDIHRMLEVNGSAAAYDMVFDQLTMQFKAMNPSVADSVWLAIKAEVFEPQLVELNALLIPIYRKHFTHEEVKDIIAFYQSPVGQKLAGITHDINMETMGVSQQWAGGVMQMIQKYLVDGGHAKPNPFMGN